MESLSWVRSPGPALRASAEAAYDDAFPPELRAPFEDLFADEVLVYADGERAAGLVVLRRIGPERWAFVRYFLTAQRGGGVGSRMMAALREELGADVRVVLDVEDPDEPGIDAEEVTLRHRRIGFYERNGLVVLPVRGYEPPHDDGHAPALLLLSTSGDDPRDVVMTVLAERYRLAPDHPAVRRALTESGWA